MKNIWLSIILFAVSLTGGTLLSVHLNNKHNEEIEAANEQRAREEAEEFESLKEQAANLTVSSLDSFYERFDYLLGKVPSNDFALEMANLKIYLVDAKNASASLDCNVQVSKYNAYFDYIDSHETKYFKSENFIKDLDAIGYFHSFFKKGEVTSEDGLHKFNFKYSIDFYGMEYHSQYRIESDLFTNGSYSVNWTLGLNNDYTGEDHFKASYTDFFILDNYINVVGKNLMRFESKLGTGFGLFKIQ